MAQLASRSPETMLLHWHDASLPWPVQTHAFGGYQEPQDPSLMPVSLAQFSKPVVQPLPVVGTPALRR